MVLPWRSFSNTNIVGGHKLVPLARVTKDTILLYGKRGFIDWSTFLNRSWTNIQGMPGQIAIDCAHGGIWQSPRCSVNIRFAECSNANSRWRQVGSMKPPWQSFGWSNLQDFENYEYISKAIALSILSTNPEANLEISYCQRYIWYPNIWEPPQNYKICLNTYSKTIGLTSEIMQCMKVNQANHLTAIQVSAIPTAIEETQHPKL